MSNNYLLIANFNEASISCIAFHSFSSNFFEYNFFDKKNVFMDNLNK